MTIVTLGIDLGKTICSLAGLDEAGRVVLRKRNARANRTHMGSNSPAGLSVNPLEGPDDLLDALF